MSQDRIALKGLRVKGFHGVLESERVDGQDFLVDAVVEIDTRHAAATDELAATLDYAGLAKRLADVVAGEPVALIETLAARLCDVVLADRRVERVEITVHKPGAPIPLAFQDVSVTLVRLQQ